MTFIAEQFMDVLPLNVTYFLGSGCVTFRGTVEIFSDGRSRGETKIII